MPSSTGPRGNSDLRAVVQRVARARVLASSEVAGEIRSGLCVLLGVASGDAEPEAVRLAGKIARLRIFPNESGKLALSVLDTGGSVLVVSQFTLIADTGRGNRPSFAGAASPERAEPLVTRFCAQLAALGATVRTGVFGAAMQVELVNDGPVTIILDA